MRFAVVYFRKFIGDVGEITKKYANLPESYVKRTMEEVEWRTPRGLPQYRPAAIVRKKTHFTTNSPWTQGFQKDNSLGRRHAKIFLEPVGEWSFFKGDRVEVLTGPDKGKQGKIIQVIQERNWVIVEGLNTKLKTMGKTKDFPGIVFPIEQPLLVKREVALVDPADLKYTAIEWRYTEEGDKVRVSPRTGRIIPIPVEAEETYDYKVKRAYKESPKDTKDGELTKITFSPALKTFEMDIMESMGIEEDRIPAKTYWY